MSGIISFLSRKSWLLKAAVIIFIIYAMADAILSNWGALLPYIENINYMLFAASFAPLLAYIALVAAGWRMVLDGMSYKIGLGESIKIRTVSDLGRYLPGKIWCVVGRAFWCEKAGIPKRDAFVSTIIEIALNMASGLIIFIIFLPFMTISSALVIPAVIVLALAFFLLIEPRAFSSVANRVLRKLKMQEIEVRISRKKILLTLAYFVATWAVFGVSFYMFLNSFYAMPLASMGVMTGIFAFSFVIGFVVLIAPGGLGVREGVMSLLLAAFMPLPLAIAVSLLSRVWFMAGEFLIAGAPIILSR